MIGKFAARRSRDEVVWNVVAVGAAIAAGVAANFAMKAAWRRARHSEPPENPAAPDVDWFEALVWTGFISLVIGLARLIAGRSTAAGWKRFTGRPPPLK